LDYTGTCSCSHSVEDARDTNSVWWWEEGVVGLEDLIKDLRV